MLMRTDPFRDFDRLANAVMGTSARPTSMPMDAYREDGHFVVEMELPGVDPGSIDLTIERNVLTVHAERKASHGDSVERVVSERSYGVFSRQLFLGETLDADRLRADYEAGVLRLTIPVAEQAKPRKISVNAAEGRREISG